MSRRRKRLKPTAFKADVDAILSTNAYDPASTDDYEIDKELSTPDATVFKNRKSGQATIAYRGTKNFDDLGADLDVFLGRRKHHRFKDALDVASKATNKYGKDNVRATGHSLGGTLALHVNKNLGLAAKVFNPGASPIFPETNNTAEIVRNQGDLVSSGIKGSKISTRKESLLSKIFPGIFGHVFRQLINHGSRQFHDDGTP